MAATMSSPLLASMPIDPEPRLRETESPASAPVTPVKTTKKRKATVDIIAADSEDETPSTKKAKTTAKTAAGRKLKVNHRETTFLNLEPC